MTVDSYKYFLDIEKKERLEEKSIPQRYSSGSILQGQSLWRCPYGCFYRDNLTAMSFDGGMNGKVFRN